MSYQLRDTPHGHEFGLARSALQKSIRRGLEDEALYWVFQLDGAGYTGYCWRTLKVIAVEDVGLANPDAIVQVNALGDFNEELRKHDKAKNRLNMQCNLAMATMLLARSPKSRLVDDANTVHSAEAEDPDFKREVPDYALDRHTAQGRRMGRGWDHFFEEGCRIDNAVEGIGGTGSGQPDEENPYRERLRRVFAEKAQGGKVKQDRQLGIPFQ